MKKQNIIIFNQHSSYITIDIANAMHDSGKYGKVILMTGVVNERETPLNSGIKIIKTLKYNKKNIVTRFSSWLFAFVHFVILIKLKYRKAKLLLVSNPPLITFIPYFCRNKYSTLIFDVYPDALKTGGFVSEHSNVYKFWSKSNIKLYKASEQVFTISEGMKECISQYCDRAKIEVVHLWSSFEPEIIKRKDNLFLAKMNLLDKFVIMYSGNMGKGCGLESLIELADRLRSNKDIVFLFIGEGWLADELKNSAIRKQLTNCTFLPYQPVSILRHSLSAADISVISLPPGVSSISIPNKTYTLLALGRPLLCLADGNSDLGKLIVQDMSGCIFHNYQINEMQDWILKLKTDHKFKHQIEQNSFNSSAKYTKFNSKIFTTI
jgi:glycosyltransferase involved in cell wall biosynthesis